MATFTMFVYGTLKQGQPNHYLMDNVKNGTAKFLGKANTKDSFPMVVTTLYNIPFILAREGQGKIIHGEVYEVNEPMLRVLDDLERHPFWYERSKTSVVMTDSTNETKECWIYFLKKFKTELLDLPYIDSYDSNLFTFNRDRYPDYDPVMAVQPVLVQEQEDS